VPFTFFDTKSNQIQGVMVDIITEIGKDAHLYQRLGSNRSLEPCLYRVVWLFCRGGARPKY